MALSETAASPASRTNLDLTLPQGNNFAQLPSLLIHPPFPELLDHGGLGHTLLMGMGGVVGGGGRAFLWKKETSKGLE